MMAISVGPTPPARDANGCGTGRRSVASGVQRVPIDFAELRDNRGVLTPRRANKEIPELARLRRRFARELHTRHSHRIMTGMIGLLVLCECLSGKPGATHHSLQAIDSTHRPMDFQPRVVLRTCGAKPLLPAAAPGLYAVLANICARAGMGRAPELYLLPVPDMNAFALGAPDSACITVTQGLLRSFSRAEVEGILAHEVAHVVNHDTGAMSWAASIQNKIAGLALRGVVDRAAQGADRAGVSPHSMLLASTSAIAHLLFMAFSRTRELDADALAVELIGDPDALAAALSKLERFHTGLSPLGAHLRHDALSRSLHSHPGTWERISRLV